MDVLLSAAVSVDGYLDDASPERLRLSSPEDWAAVLRLRARHDAILVGANTVRRDNPSLVIRDENLRDGRARRGLTPDIMKITLTRGGELDPRAAFFTEGTGRKVVFSTKPLENLPAEVVVAKEITASFIVDWLARNGVRSLMVEGGAQVLAMFMREKAAGWLRLAVAPLTVGAGTRLDLPAVPRFELANLEKLGDTSVMLFKLGVRSEEL